ncbi:predicted protein [Nematostella vectensis]|uniref:G-protein coupled receptors family 1 profile domain-containing protein n=1 Tax=Nematostella vectensis TaxID=45351 RepID=A7RJC8_NEMVE|nr:predicted protein [Nematostella vectensis]|eukprot:XP_001640417.1 predicted protein [Nematostella vectensis]
MAVWEEGERLNTDLQQRSQVTIVVEFTMFFLFGLFAIVGNAMVCAAIYRQPRLRVTTNYYVAALAIFDIFQSCVSLPLVLGVIVTGRWPYGRVVCHIQGFSVPMFGFASILILLLIALNRYVKIIKTRAKYNKYFSPKKAIASIFAAFCTGVVGTLILNTKFEFDPGKLFCFADGGRTPIPTAFAIGFLFFLLPFSLMCYCYLKIYLKIRQHKRHVVLHLRNSAQRAPNRKEINTTKTFFAVLVVFIICYLQIPIIEVIRKQNSFLPRQVFVFYTIMGGLSSVLNVLVYSVMNCALRLELKKILCGLRQRQINPAVASNNAFVVVHISNINHLETKL